MQRNISGNLILTSGFADANRAELLELALRHVSNDVVTRDEGDDETRHKRGLAKAMADAGMDPSEVDIDSSDRVPLEVRAREFRQAQARGKGTSEHVLVVRADEEKLVIEALTTLTVSKLLPELSGHEGAWHEADSPEVAGLRDEIVALQPGQELNSDVPV